jgi:hypothetical protein
MTYDFIKKRGCTFSQIRNRKDSLFWDYNKIFSIHLHNFFLIILLSAKQFLSRINLLLEDCFESSTYFIKFKSNILYLYNQRLYNKIRYKIVFQIFRKNESEIFTFLIQKNYYNKSLHIYQSQKKSGF